MRDWKALVHRHVPVTGDGLAQHTIDELAAHLEDIYADALAAGRSEAEAFRTAEAALAESAAALPRVPRPRTRTAEARAINQPPTGTGMIGMVGDLRFALRQWRRAPSFAAVAILTLGLGAGRRDRDLQHRQYRAAPSAAVPRPRAARDDLGEQCGKGAAEGAAVAGELHGLSKYWGLRSRRRRRGGGRR